MYIDDVFRYMKHIFLMYRCNSPIGFGGEMNDMLSVSVVSGETVLWTNCHNKALLINSFGHIKTYSYYSTCSIIGMLINVLMCPISISHISILKTAWHSVTGQISFILAQTWIDIMKKEKVVCALLEHIFSYSQPYFHESCHKLCHTIFSSFIKWSPLVAVTKPNPSLKACPESRSPLIVTFRLQN